MGNMFFSNSPAAGHVNNNLHFAVAVRCLELFNFEYSKHVYFEKIINICKEAANNSHNYHTICWHTAI